MATATVSAATVPVTTVEHPLRNSNYRLWLIGGTISLLGDQFYLVALPWQPLDSQGSRGFESHPLRHNRLTALKRSRHLVRKSSTDKKRVYR